MSVKYYEKEKIFKIDTQNTSYVFCVSDYDYIEHLYYGKHIDDVDIKGVSNRQIYSFSATEEADNRAFSLGTVLRECSVLSSGDNRIPSLVIDSAADEESCRYRYKSHKIYGGREKIDGLPCSRNVGGCESLEVVLKNDLSSVTVVLHYNVYAREDVICRHTEIINDGDVLYLDKAASACVDFYGSDFDLITLEGMYLCECSEVQRTALRKGLQGNSSLTGTTSHHANPFFALAAKNADENGGEVYGFNLVYSGNFKNEIEVNRLGDTRVVGGINDTGFKWKLEKGRKFSTPEFVMTFSADGIGGMSRNMHDHIRNNLTDPEYAFESRPIVINSWEAFYFDVSEDKLIRLAEKAKKCGIDTVVLDDGWFRNDAKSGLGDFYADKTKFPHGLKGVSEKIHAMGLKFGIWLEPEMTAVESEFYKKNGGKILSKDKRPLIYRNQFVIDLTDDENAEFIKNRIVDELKGVNPEYIKWDCNRYITEFGSHNCANGEVAHRQVLGVYKLLEKLKKELKGVMFETCAGGGGRFDSGMLYYSPQIWASDNTDPYARIYTQYGMSLAYPQSSVSCHFSEGECTSGRPSTFDFRYSVASFGAYGYELDLAKYSDEDIAKIEKYSEKYRSTEKFVLSGDLYRLLSPETDEFCAYIDVLKDKSEALFTFIEINTTGHTENLLIRLKGLDENALYENTFDGTILSGGALMNVGIRMCDLFKERGGSGRRILFKRVNR